MAFLDNLRALVSKLARPFVRPTQVCTHVHTCISKLAINCDSVWLGLNAVQI